MINTILLGCGRIGKMHCENILSNFRNVSLNAIFDEALTDNYQGIPVYKRSQLENYLNQYEIDAAVIATPSTTHCDLIKIMLSRNVATFCEKPVSFNLNQLNDLISLPGFVQVGLNRRWDADILKLKKKLDDRCIGNIELIKITNRDPIRPDIEFVKKSGGLFYDFNIHDFDMVRFLTGMKITQVFAQGGVNIDERLKDVGDIDNAIITMKLNNGAMVVIDASRETNSGYDQRIEIFGSEGVLSVDNILESRLTTTSQNGIRLNLPLPDFMSRYYSAYIDQLHAFFNCIINKQSSPVTLQDVYEAVSISLACEKAIVTKSPVNL